MASNTRKFLNNYGAKKATSINNKKLHMKYDLKLKEGFSKIIHKTRTSRRLIQKFQEKLGRKVTDPIYKKKSKDVLNNFGFLGIDHRQIEAYKQKLRFRRSIAAKNLFFKEFRRIHKKQIVRMLRVSRKIPLGFVWGQFIRALTSRLDLFLYEANFALSVSESRDLIKSGVIFVNGKAIFQDFFTINLNDIVERRTFDCLVGDAVSVLLNMSFRFLEAVNLGVFLFTKLQLRLFLLRKKNIIFFNNKRVFATFKTISGLKYLDTLLTLIKPVTMFKYMSREIFCCRVSKYNFFLENALLFQGSFFKDEILQSKLSISNGRELFLHVFLLDQSFDIFKSSKYFILTKIKSSGIFQIVRTEFTKLFVKKNRRKLFYSKNIFKSITRLFYLVSHSRIQLGFFVSPIFKGPKAIRVGLFTRGATRFNKSWHYFDKKLVKNREVCGLFTIFPKKSLNKALLKYPWFSQGLSSKDLYSRKNSHQLLGFTFFKTKAKSGKTLFYFSRDNKDDLRAYFFPKITKATYSESRTLLNFSAKRRLYFLPGRFFYGQDGLLVPTIFVRDIYHKLKKLLIGPTKRKLAPWQEQNIPGKKNQKFFYNYQTKVSKGPFWLLYKVLGILPIYRPSNLRRVYFSSEISEVNYSLYYATIFKDIGSNPESQTYSKMFSLPYLIWFVLRFV
jgi:ribosomal protein S4